MGSKRPLYSMHLDISILVATRAPSLSRDCTYTLVNCQNAPGSRCPKTIEGGKSVKQPPPPVDQQDEAAVYSWDDEVSMDKLE
jgi:hypothetical protein